MKNTGLPSFTKLWRAHNSIIDSLTMPGLAPTPGFQVRPSGGDPPSYWEAIPRRGVPGRRPRNVKESIIEL
eukprot:490235-Prorocentrum_minimum.AAC.1